MGAATLAFIVLLRGCCRSAGLSDRTVDRAVAVAVLHLPVGHRGRSIPGMAIEIPAPHLPQVVSGAAAAVLPSAFTIALLAGIEALLSAVVADGMTGYSHRSGQELVGQGVANIVSALFGGLPATGAIARTATNIRAGGRTPIAASVSCVFLLLFLLVAGQADRLRADGCAGGDPAGRWRGE